MFIYAFTGSSSVYFPALSIVLKFDVRINAFVTLTYKMYILHYANRAAVFWRSYYYISFFCLF